MWALIFALLLQSSTEIPSEWTAGNCINAEEHVWPEWEYMYTEFAPVLAIQNLPAIDGSRFYKWTISRYEIRYTGPGGTEYIYQNDQWHVSSWQAMNVPGLWCSYVRAVGNIEGYVFGLSAPNIKAIKQP